MSLTVGTGPFGHRPAGALNISLPPDGVVLVEPSPRWIRARIGAHTVVDTRRAKLLYETGSLARYYVPRDDVDWDAVTGQPIPPPSGAPGLDGYVTFAWDAFDAWLEEDYELIAHAPDPYHRIDVRPTSRRVVLGAGGVPLAESTAARALFETGLPTRWYLPREDVRVALEPSGLRTACAYKGVASYWNAGGIENVAWSYPDPRHDALEVRDLVCFFNEHVDLELDGELQERPATPWSRPGWWR